MKFFLPYSCLTLLLLLLTGLGARAQPDSIVFGKLDPKYLTAAPFAADTSAEAVVLCDYGKATIVSDDNERRQLRFDWITRIKILKKSGFDWAKVEVQLRHETPGFIERLMSLQGYTYNLVNGQVVREPLPKTSIFLDKVSSLYSVQKFALPQVREGSVIEFSYSILSDYLLAFRSWKFQRRIPVRWSEFRAAIPYRYTYKMFLQSKQPLAINEQTDQKSLTPSFRWAMRDVPALPIEPYMTTPADFVDELTFELATYSNSGVTLSWPQIGGLITREWDLNQQGDLPILLQADLARLPLPPPNQVPERLAAVRTLVYRAVKCTGERGLYTSGSLRKAYRETHLGTTAEVNLLLVLALRAAGFRADPVLLSTRAHGRVKTTLPLLSQFNYVAAHVQLPGGESLVLDATDPLLPYDMLPEACLNQQARLVPTQPDTSRWVPLRPRHRHTHLQRVQLQLAADGTLRGQMHEEYGGYAGAEARTELQQLGDKKYASRVASQRTAWAVTAVTIANRDSVHLPLALEYTFTLPAEQQKLLGTIYLSPLRDFGITHNPFRSETRLYPVDFGMAQEETLLVTLTLPVGYELTELPKSQALDLPKNGGRFVCSVAATGATVQLTSRLLLRNPLYTAAEYGQLRELYRLLLTKQAEQLIIRKKA